MLSLSELRMSMVALYDVGSESAIDPLNRYRLKAPNFHVVQFSATSDACRGYCMMSKNT